VQFQMNNINNVIDAGLGLLGEAVPTHSQMEVF
jgi:hypothetical protein